MRTAALLAALALAGCATTNFELTVMPRDSGKIYTGTAQFIGAGEGPISITLEDKTYNGSWVETQPSTTTGYVSGGFGYGYRGRAYGFGGGFMFGAIGLEVAAKYAGSLTADENAPRTFHDAASDGARWSLPISLVLRF